MASPHDAPRLNWAWVWIYYPLLYIIGRLLFVFLGPVRVFGRRNLPRSGGYLVICNHRSDIDPLLLYAGGLHRQFRCIAKSELFEMKIVGAILRAAGTIPIRRNSADREAIRLAVRHLKAGHPVCIFPEGQLSESGVQGPFLSGFALIAAMADVPIVPCGIRNSEKILPYSKVVPRAAFLFVDVRFGPARKFEAGIDHREVVRWAEEAVRDLSGY